MDELTERLSDAVEFARLSGRVTMTDEAAQAWTEPIRNCRPTVRGLLGAVTARAEAQVIRLALLYALLDSKGEIDTAHLEARHGGCGPIAMNRRTSIFGDSLGDPIADDILFLRPNAAKG